MKRLLLILAVLVLAGPRGAADPPKSELHISIRTAAELELFAAKQDLPGVSLMAYRFFLRDKEIPESEKKLARERLPVWEALAEGKQPTKTTATAEATPLTDTPIESVKPSAVIDKRTHWLNESYNETMYKIEGARWEEKNNATGKVVLSYTQTKRNKDYIEFRCPSRGYDVRILTKGDRMEIKKKGASKWEWVAKGHWISGTGVAAERLTAESVSTGIESRTDAELESLSKLLGFRVHKPMSLNPQPIPIHGVTLTGITDQYHKLGFRDLDPAKLKFCSPSGMYLWTAQDDSPMTCNLRTYTGKEDVVCLTFYATTRNGPRDNVENASRIAGRLAERAAVFVPEPAQKERLSSLLMKHVHDFTDAANGHKMPNGALRNSAIDVVGPVRTYCDGYVLAGVSQVSLRIESSDVPERKD